VLEEADRLASTHSKTSEYPVDKPTRSSSIAGYYVFQEQPNGAAVFAKANLIHAEKSQRLTLSDQRD
jgi:hypothetical protein